MSWDGEKISDHQQSWGYEDGPWKGPGPSLLVTAFTTGNLFVVLTVLTEGCKQLFETYDLKKDKTDTYVDVIVPILP